MSSLHPKSLGTRKNTDKRAFVGKYLLQLEYRVIGAQPRSLLSMARLNIARSRGPCSMVRIAQTCLLLTRSGHKQSQDRRSSDLLHACVLINSSKHRKGPARSQS